jgi:hypothetical protein
MHLKSVERPQSSSCSVVDSIAQETARTKWAVDGVLHLIRTAADEIESNCRLPDAIVTAMRDSGINRLLIPTALGEWRRRSQA